MREQGIDHCISVAPESLYYYGGYDSWVSANSPQALIFSAADDEPTIVLRDTDLSLAYESSWIAARAHGRAVPWFTVGDSLFAHTGPYYIGMRGGRHQARRDAAAPVARP